MGGTEPWLIGAVAAELRQNWAGASIQRILQPEPRELWLQLYGRRQSTHLVICADPDQDGLFLAQGRAPAAAPPGPFCMGLRRHLQGGRLQDCLQPGLERAAHLHLASRDELGNPRHLTLVAELSGRFANIVLLGPDGRVIDALRRVGEHNNRSREVGPGLAYAPPPVPAGKIDPALVLQTEGAAALVAALDRSWAGRAAGEDPADRLMQTVFGTGRVLATAILAWASGAPGAPPPPAGAEAGSPVAQLVAAVAASATAGPVRPCVGTDRRGLAVALAWPLPGWSSVEAPSPSAACAAAAATRRAKLRRDGLAARLAAILRAASERTSRRLAKQEAEWEAACGAQALLEAGQLLLAYPDRVPRGATGIDLPAFDDPNRLVHIALDPRSTASANAQSLLRRYQKEKRARVAIAAHLEAARAELGYLQEAEVALGQAEDMAELEALAAELAEQGFGEPRRATTRQAPARPGPAPPHTFTSDGWRILVGRNAAGNDHLTMRLAQPQDIWLHAQRMPGSHVLLRRPADAADPAADPPPAVLAAAARCAAYYSAGRAGQHIPVDWTRRRQVWKPSGARPGFVLYRQERTLIVDPVDLPQRLTD